jgi:hypothetical protein
VEVVVVAAVRKKNNLERNAQKEHRPSCASDLQICARLSSLNNHTMVQEYANGAVHQQEKNKQNTAKRERARA